MDPENPIFIRFRELANKDISDEELFDELCYVAAKNRLTIYKYSETVRRLREKDPSLIGATGYDPADKDYYLKPRLLDEFTHKYLYDTFNTSYIHKENHEMKQRIRSLEQTLATFMEQTKAERLSQEAVTQCLSKEMDEFQEEFYDCQSDVQGQKEQVDLIQEALKDTIDIIERLEAEIIMIKKCIPFTKNKME